MTMASAKAILAVVVFLVLAAPPARAEDSLYYQATQALEAKDYALAAQLLEQAYAREPNPIFLVNRGLALQWANRYDAARVAFESVLLAHADSPDACQRARQGLADIEPFLPPPPGPPKPVAPWIVTGAGAAVAGAGGLLLYLAHDKRERVRTAGQDDAGVIVGLSRLKATQLRDDANELALGGALLTGVGAAAVAGGLLWAVMTWPDLEDEPSSGVDVVAGEEGASLIWTVTF